MLGILKVVHALLLGQASEKPYDLFEAIIISRYWVGRLANMVRFHRFTDRFGKIGEQHWGSSPQGRIEADRLQFGQDLRIQP